jgi:uncharacterized protein YbjT (DUF2867 family)
VILLVGGTGTLGSEVARRLSAQGRPLRVLTRDPIRAAHLPAGVEVVQGDLRRPETLAVAVKGVEAIIAAAHGFVPAGGSPRAVDRDGTINLLGAATQAGVSKIVFVSVYGARADHPMELARMKYAAEQSVRGSGLVWTILRPMPFLETWIGVIGAATHPDRSTLIFGRGTNPIGFVSARDVAHWVERALEDYSLRAATVDLVGPADLSLRQLAATTAGKAPPTVRHVPRPVLRMAGQALRPFRPGLARMIRAALLMDTTIMTAPATTTRQTTTAREVADVTHGRPVGGRSPSG